MPNLDRTNTDRVFWLLFFALSAFNLAAIAFSPLNLAPDESHYWEWSRRLDWSYYSKGPLVALLIAASRKVFGDTEFGVRFPAFLLFTVFSLLYYLFVRRFFLPVHALLSWLALRSMLIFAQTGVVMTTDAPAALFWFLALASAYLAVVEERREFWIPFGLFIGLGVSAKYTVGILFPSIVAFLVLAPQLRTHFRSLFFYGGVAAFLATLYPILKWNADHGWVNFQHNAGHLVQSNASKISPKFLPEMLAGQLGLGGPIVFCALVYGIYRGWGLWRRGDIPAGLLLFSSLPLGALVCGLSLTKRVYANWPMPFYIGALLLFTHLVSQRAIGGERLRKLTVWGIILNFAITLAAHLPYMGYPLGIAGKILPTKKLVGWDRLGSYVADKMNASLGKGDGMPFVLGDDYEVVSSIAFYSVPRPEVFCANTDGRRMNQYDVWGGLQDKKGQTALIVVKSPEKVELLRKHFASVTPVDAPAELGIDYSGSHLRNFYFFWGERYDGSVPVAPEKR